ncbi:signal peptidase I [Dongia sp. agr-C8]
MRSEPRRDWVVYPLAILGLLMLIVFGFIGITSTPYNMPARSMLPNLQVGDRFFAWRGYYQDHAPERGEIAIFRTPRGDDYTKRVIGLPGDTIQMKAGRLWINGAEVERKPEGDVTDETFGTLMQYREMLPDGASYLILERDDASFLDEVGPFQVPADAYFMMGDNRDNSNDSRMPEMGAVPRASFQARPYLIYYSPDLERIGSRVN